MKQEKTFIYLVTYTVGAKRQKFIAKNHVKVPNTLLITMGKEKIEHEISTYGEQAHDKLRNKLRKESSIEIEDLNEVPLYELNLKFEENGQIQNRPVEVGAGD